MKPASGYPSIGDFKLRPLHLLRTKTIRSYEENRENGKNQWNQSTETDIGLSFSDLLLNVR